MEEPAQFTTPEPATARRGPSGVEWLAVVAGVLGLLVSALRWYEVTGPFADQVARSGLPTGRTAWGAGVPAWLPMVLLALAAALMLAPRFGARVPFAPLLWLVCALASVVLVIIRWVTIVPHDLPAGVDAGPGVGLYLGLAVAVGSLVGALLDFRAWRH